MTPTLGWIFLVVASVCLGWLYVVRQRLVRLKEKIAGLYPPPETITIEVTIDCDSEGISINVDPWAAHVDPGTSVEWKLKSTSGATARFEAKDPGQWPFPNLPAQVPIQAGGKEKAGRVNAGATGRYQYTILATCGGTNLTIDPDFWVW